MEYFDNTTRFSELSINNAPLVRCSGLTHPTCGRCESCEIGSQLSYTKQWFLRCADQLKRQFVLGLVHRFNSVDLHGYVNTLLSCLEGKDFIYTRSRNRPSLQCDVSSSSSNHALDKYQIRKDMLECLDWFETRPYWTKCNFMLGIMQVCNAQILQIIGSESRSLCSYIDKDINIYESMQHEETGTQNEAVLQIQTCSSTISSGAITSPRTPTQENDHPTTSTPKSELRPRSALKQHGSKSQETRLMFGVSFSEIDETFESRPCPSNDRSKTPTQTSYETSSGGNMQDSERKARPRSGKKSRQQQHSNYEIFSSERRATTASRARPQSGSNESRKESKIFESLVCEKGGKFESKSRPSSGGDNRCGKQSQYEISSSKFSDNDRTKDITNRTPEHKPRPHSGNRTIRGQETIFDESSEPRLSSYRNKSEQHAYQEALPSSEDEAELYDDDYISVDPSSITEPPLSSSGMLIEHYKDFIRCLPVHLSKFILNVLDETSLINCLCVSKHWRYLAEEVQKDSLVRQIMVEEVMVMQGANAKGLNPKYAKKVFVSVPDYTKSKDIQNTRHLTQPTKVYRNRMDELEFRSMAHCYEGVGTVKVEVEERNLYCGAYNVFVLQDLEDRTRCATFNDGQLVACASSDRKIRLLDATTGRSEKNISGHAGSVKCLYISEKKGFVISGSYDTSIRCWDIKHGKCMCIFRGHRASVLCLSFSGRHLVSGSRDKIVKVWNFDNGRCRRSFRHNHVVLCVEVKDNIVVSGCEGCKVKVWEIESARLVKTLEGHQSPITGVAFTKYHIISSSRDCYALAWSAVGKYKKCLQAFRHPKEVLCVKLMYCRVITGSADGKLRVWNLLNGDCLRIIRGNSKNDVITSVYIANESIVINTLSNLLILNFEPVKFSYTLPPDRPESLGGLRNYPNCPPRRRPRSYVRAQKRARGAAIESLITRTTSSRPLFTCLDRSVSMTPYTILASSSRVSSAPPYHRITRNITESIDHHVRRLSKSRDKQPCEQQPRERKPRPHSSPAKIRHRTPPKEPDQLRDESTEPVFTKDLVTLCPKPGPLPDKNTRHVVSRGRSAPAIRTKVLPGSERGWTTSYKGVASQPSNKLVPTATQSRDMIKKRPRSAQVVMTTNENGASVLRSVSCLNLKTFSDQQHDEEQLRNQYISEKLTKGKQKLRRPNSSKI